MKYIFHSLIFFALIISGVAGCANQTEQKRAKNTFAQNFNADWGKNKLWDDGLAEVAIYAAERIVYNKKRVFDYTQITVKEDFNQKFNVKTDDYKRQDLFPVMKVNQFCRIETDNYPYHYLSSLFFKREDALQVHKITLSSQEWCGNTFKAVNATGNKYTYTYNSYWDGEGEGSYTLDKNILFEDQLAYTLRSLNTKNNLTFKANIASLLQTNKANKPVIYDATLVVLPDESVGTETTWKVTVNLTADKQNIYWFAQKYPNLLVKQKTWDSRTLQLKEVKRIAYWQH